VTVESTLARLPDVAPPFSWERSGELTWLEARMAGGRAAFSTRAGGVSDGPFRSLNLGILTDDAPERVKRNRGLLAVALGRNPALVAMGRQVHGAAIQVRRAPEDAGSFELPLREADAQLTGSTSVTPLVLVADCVPLVLAAGDGAAAVHCGWRGVAAGIVGRSLAALCVLAQCGPEAVSCAIGPAIGPCCYEVGDEVRRSYREMGHVEALLPSGSLDLALAIRRELERAGAAADRIFNCGICTSCNPELFFSHRRDRGRCGRQAGLAWLS
jgi:polyphenol oxidase